jgi:hypothetical protein
LLHFLEINDGIKPSVVLPGLMNNGKIMAYEFYRRVGNGRDHFVGTLPERRKDPSRITEDSILNWARILFSRMNEEEFRKDIYYVQVEI